MVYAVDSEGSTRTTAALTSAVDGWWTADIRLPHGSDYAFALDGGDPRPDPRSAWQPAGVHAASRVFDPERHLWRDAAWSGRDVRESIIMEIHIGTFTPTGTLDAAIDRLDHLVNLGIDMVELMPVAAFAGAHGWGYDGVALYAVQADYGGPAALQRFVDAAHQRGIAVCLDVVYNHLGPSGNYLDLFAPYFTDRHETPWGKAINLDDRGSSEVRRWIIENACRWCRDFHIDALRLDAVHALVDDSSRHLLAELAERIDALALELGRPLSLIAESDLNDSRMIESTAQGGLGMTAQWADDVHHAVHATMSGERHGYYVDFGGLDVLRHALTRVFVHDGGFSTFRGKNWGRPVPEGTDARRFVVFASDHDQIGNRALGDRPSARIDDDGLAIEATLILTSAFTPMLFMGEEWGARTPWQFFTDHQEPELAEAIRQGRSREFGGHGWTELYGGAVEVPDPQASTTMQQSRIDWSELDSPRHQRLLEWHRSLIALRRSEPALSSGKLDAVRVDIDPNERWLLVRRGDIRVIVVLSEAAVELEPGPNLDSGTYRDTGADTGAGADAGKGKGAGTVAGTDTDTDTDSDKRGPKVTTVLAAWKRDGLAIESSGRVRLPGRSATILRTGGFLCTGSS